MKGAAVPLLLLVLVAGSVASAGPSEAVRPLWDQPCDHITKRCPVTVPEDAGLPPLVGAQAGSPLRPLQPYLPTNVYRTLDDLFPEGGVVVPVPARPTNVSVDRDVHVHFNEKVAGLHPKVNEHLHIHQEVIPAHAGSEEGQVPCRDERGCPDLVVDPSRLLVGTIEDRAFESDHCAVQEASTQPGTRRLLRFTFTSVNVGDGDLRIGQPHLNPQWFEWGACHGHYHFTRYAEYRLWTPEGYLAWQELRGEHPDAMPADLLAAHPDLASQMVAGHKQGFCAIDVWPYVPVDPQKYIGCDSVQGISRGWADEYGFQLDGQWIDVTGLPAGAYVLEAEANPGRLYREIDYANNAAAIVVAVPPAAVPAPAIV